MKDKINKTIIYKAKGIVLGENKGGAIGAYYSKEVIADSLEELYKKIDEGIKDGSLDGGFPFCKLMGAMMIIQKIQILNDDNQTYKILSTKKYYTKGLTHSEKLYMSQYKVK